jgi:hypothetical protein
VKRALRVPGICLLSWLAYLGLSHTLAEHNIIAALLRQELGALHTKELRFAESLGGGGRHAADHV